MMGDRSELSSAEDASISTTHGTTAYEVKVNKENNE